MLGYKLNLGLCFTLREDLDAIQHIRFAGICLMSTETFSSRLYLGIVDICYRDYKDQTCCAVAPLRLPEAT